MNYSPVGHQEPELNSYSSPSATASQPTYPLSPLRSPNYTHTSLGPPSSASPSSPSEPAPQLVPSPRPEAAPKHAPDKVGVAARRPYHPNPPAHRSEWVMWSGNVPSDATHDELWRFFTKHPSGADENTNTGVMSIFLISRSSCAFVNFESEKHLHEAIERFNGVSLRPHDPRCPRLVCRVRKKDDDLKAGVGGQRGVGMHSKWVKNNKGKGKVTEASDQSDLDDSSSAVTTPSVSVSSDDGRILNKRSSGSSYASTNSSLLVRYFPKRYFILKSLSQVGIRVVH
jgi:RNA recognition motif-containing protein